MESLEMERWTFSIEGWQFGTRIGPYSEGKLQAMKPWKSLYQVARQSINAVCYEILIPMSDAMCELVA
jgi:hypothetical protein